jgi:hypothetical protein
MNQQGYGQQPPTQGYGHPPQGWGPPPQPPPKKSWGKRLLVLIAVAFGVLVLGVVAIGVIASMAAKAGKAASASLEQAGNRTMDRIKGDVLKDAVDQYNLVKSTGGSAIQLCTQAGMAYAAAVQAKDEAAVRTWQWQQKQDCAAAGMPVQ